MGKGVKKTEPISYTAKIKNLLKWKKYNAQYKTLHASALY
jgi:hypothetical protein